jgi:hypothetical protein
VLIGVDLDLEHFAQALRLRAVDQKLQTLAGEIVLQFCPIAFSEPASLRAATTDSSR